MNIKKILLPTLLFIPLLQGCIATGIVAGAAVAGLIVYDSRSSKTMLDDYNIGYKAQGIINKDTELKNHSNISVSSFNNVVLLTGEADNESLKEHAQTIINNVQGIKHIHNQVTIGPKVSAATLSNDALITTKVKAALLNENGLKTTQLKVITENSTVYLIGLTSREAGDLAAKTTKDVPGVNKVVKVFEYQ